MKTSQAFASNLSKVHNKKSIRMLFMVIMLGILIISVSIHSSAVDTVVAAPQKTGGNSVIPILENPSANLTLPSATDLKPPPPPENNEYEDFPVSLSNVLSNATSITDVSAGVQTQNFVSQTSWSYISDYPSDCILDFSKRALTIQLVFPQYMWNGSLGSSSEGLIWHGFWLWRPSSQKWEFTGWMGPIKQIAELIPNFRLYDVIFRNLAYDHYGFNRNFSVFKAVLPAGSGLSGPSWVMVERYVALKNIDGSYYTIPSKVIFNNGTMYCGASFPLSTQSNPEAEGAAMSAELAPTPPADVNFPTFTFLPIVLKPGNSNPDQLPTPTPFPTFPAPPTPFSPPTTTEIDNANFDADPNMGWTEYSKNGYSIIMEGPKGFSARSTPYLAWLGGVHNEDSSITQQMTVPDTHPYLSLHVMATSEEDLCVYDRAVIKVDEMEVAYFGLCKEYNNYNWLKHQIDLSNFAGKTVDLTLQVVTDNSLLSSLFIDDLSFESGVFIPTPVPSPTPAPTNNPIRNPGFELGNNGDWGSYSISNASNIFRLDGSHSGNWLSWIGGLDNEIGYIDQMIAIPQDKPYLTYWGWINSAETTCGVDKIKFFAGNTELFGYNLCSAYNSTQWGLGWVNLSAYVGTTQRIRVQVQTNSSLLSSLYMDDFYFAANPPTSMMFSESGNPPSVINGLPGSTGIAPSGEVITATEPGVKGKNK